MFRKKEEEVKKKSGSEFFIALILVILFLNHFHLLQGVTKSQAATTTSASSGEIRATAIDYARGQLGKPYLWGGLGPYSYDCSGLMYEAYKAAGITIPRTSQEQWAAGPRVSVPEPGDLVFFAGSDGTYSSPGHVGMVIGHGKMIEAYSNGYPIRIVSYLHRGAIGFTDPGGSAVYPVPGHPDQKRWAKLLLKNLHDPRTHANLSSLITWELREGGNWVNDAHYNPLNTTHAMPGYSETGTQGNIGSYVSWTSGMAATVATLHDGKYRDLLHALRSGRGLYGHCYKGLWVWSGHSYCRV